MTLDLSKTLEQLENKDWGEHNYPSYLVTRCHALRRKPLQEFSAGDLRIIIGQNISLELLMPLAINDLEQNILAEGDYYPGDLLKDVLQSKDVYWKTHKEQWSTVKALCETQKELLNLGNETFDIKTAIERFSQIHCG